MKTGLAKGTTTSRPPPAKKEEKVGMAVSETHGDTKCQQ